MKRHKTDYPGVFYREVERIGGKGLERVYYIVFKQDGKVFEEKVGRQFKDDMTPARAARIRGERIEGRRQSRKEIREAATEIKWTVDRLWNQYNAGWRTDRGRYENHLKSALGGKEPQEISQIDVHRLRINLSKDPKTSDRKARSDSLATDHQLWGEKRAERRPGLQDRDAQGEQSQN